MTETPTPAELRDLAAAQGVAATLHPANRPMPTVEAAAEAIGVPVQAMTKNIVWIVAGEPVLAIAAGLARIDDRALARRFGVARAKVGMASPEPALEITGFAVGCMPSFGHRIRLPTLVDTAVLHLARVYGGTGDPAVLISLATDDLLRLTGGEPLSICRAEPA